MSDFSAIQIQFKEIIREIEQTVEQLPRLAPDVKKNTIAHVSKQIGECDRLV